MRAQPVDIKGINKRDLKASQKNNKDGWGAEDSQSESQHIDLDNENDWINTFSQNDQIKHKKLTDLSQKTAQTMEKVNVPKQLSEFEKRQNIETEKLKKSLQNRLEMEKAIRPDIDPLFCLLDAIEMPKFSYLVRESDPKEGSKQCIRTPKDEVVKVNESDSSAKEGEIPVVSKSMVDRLKSIC